MTAVWKRRTVSVVIMFDSLSITNVRDRVYSVTACMRDILSDLSYWLTVLLLYCFLAILYIQLLLIGAVIFYDIHGYMWYFSIVFRT